VVAWDRVDTTRGSRIRAGERWVHGLRVPPAVRRALPTSEAPGIEDTRRHIEKHVRAGVIASADPVLLTQWTSKAWGGEDLELWEKLVRVAPAGATRSLAQAQGAATHG
jgi:hypothetical protein